MIIRKKWTINFLKFFNKNKNTRRLHFKKIHSQKKTKYHYLMHAIKTSIVNNFSGLMHIRIPRMRAACWKIITLYFMTVFNSSPTYLLRKDWNSYPNFYMWYYTNIVFYKWCVQKVSVLKSEFEIDEEKALKIKNRKLFSRSILSN